MAHETQNDTTTAQHLCLVRHGEVLNPDGVVYASIDGFGLSSTGRDQAVATAEYLADVRVEVVVCSPLERARQTADAIAAATGAALEIDDRLTEWRLADRWAGTRWDQLMELRPGELEAYLADPQSLPFSPEPLSAVAKRVAEAAMEAANATGGNVTLVSHQDPIEAGRRILAGRDLDDFHRAKPAHGAVVTLERLRPTSAVWIEAAYWEPQKGHAFPPFHVGLGDATPPTLPRP